jgi:PAS domain-containing protein
VDSGSLTCTLCKKDLSPKAIAQRTITGNVCEECLHHVGAQAGMPLRDFLDGLGVPVLVVDGDVVVTMANKPVLALLGKNFSQVRGQRGGDVFECAYARLEGGCGRTVHCSGCAIRRAVTETFTTGRSLRGVLAYLNRDAVTQFLQLGMVISTEKAWGMVLLRVDYIGPQPEPRKVPPSH